MAALAAVGALAAGCGSTPTSTAADTSAPSAAASQPSAPTSSAPTAPQSSPATPSGLAGVDTAAWVAQLQAKGLVAKGSQPDLQKMYAETLAACRATANQLAMKYSLRGGARAMALDRVNMRHVCPSQLYKISGATDTLD
jgi:hypothetical protein